MNGKKAKQLRKLAQAETEGSPNVKYESYSPSVYQQVKKGIIVSWVKVRRGIPRKMNPNCTRYVYKQLKKVA